MIYNLENESLKIEISSLGAELNSIKKDNIEYLWQGDSKYWGRKAPVLFPIVGNLLDNEYKYNNKTFKMNQHGFARDNEFKLSEQSNNTLTFTFISNEETLKIYPFNFQFNIKYSLEKDSIAIDYKIKNENEETMYFSVGAHPAFNWPLENENKEDSYLEFENKDSINTYCLTKEGLDLKEKELILEENKLLLNEDLFKNDALIFEDSTIKSIKYKNTTNKKTIEIIFENFPFLGIWSKPDGAPFLCIEPWYGIADIINHNKNIKDKKGIVSLEKKSLFTSRYYININ